MKHVHFELDCWNDRNDIWPDIYYDYQTVCTVTSTAFISNWLSIWRINSLGGKNTHIQTHCIFKPDESAFYQMTLWNSSIDESHADFRHNRFNLGPSVSTTSVYFENQKFQLGYLSIQLCDYHLHANKWVMRINEKSNNNNNDNNRNIGVLRLQHTHFDY